MNLLAIETSNEWCSVALIKDEALFERVEKRPKMQATVILSMIRALLEEHGLGIKDIDKVAFGQGPGSFTGVRIGASVAQGLAMGRNIPIIPVPSLKAIAASAKTTKPVLVAIDARKEEVYTACFKNSPNGFQQFGKTEVLSPSLLKPPAEIESFIACGNGWSLYQSQFKGELLEKALSVEADLSARASFVARLALDLPPVAISEALPMYVRNNVVTVRKSDG
jgi:tRNA threonylcarbamoyladenosine biosynthesis protein TsaB